MRTFIENYLHFMKNCIRPHYEKLNPLKSGFIENSNFENNRDPCNTILNIKICNSNNLPIRTSIHKTSIHKGHLPIASIRSQFSLDNYPQGTPIRYLIDYALYLIEAIVIIAAFPHMSYMNRPRLRQLIWRPATKIYRN